MSTTTGILTESDGDLLVHTGVAGRASGAGHRLTIVLRRWRAVVEWDAGAPVSVEATVKVPELRVRSGEGGLTPLSEPEKRLARNNALKSLRSGRFPVITYRTSAVETIPGAFRLSGTLTINGNERPQVIDVAVSEAGDTWGLSFNLPVRQTDFGVTPYSLMMVTVKVVVEVRVSFEATYTD